MSEDRSSAGNGDNQESGIWRGLKALIFGESHEERLRDQLEDAIDRHEGDPSPEAKGDLTPLERQMVRNLLHFGERDAGDVGVPRADIVAIEEQTNFAHLVQVFAEAGVSRLPVYREKLDTIVGMVHIKDVFAILAAGSPPPEDIKGLIRQPLFVPMSRGALDLLADMRQTRVHLAVVLTDFTEIPIGRPVDPRPDLPVLDGDDRDWEPAPDGRFCIDETTTAMRACAAVAYAFWRIQAQPLATVAAAPLDRAARRHAVRASIRHDTRVVMLRRTSPLAEPPDGEPKWHYRVRFVVRGHWRRLIDRDGHPYRIWINAHIKGPDGAPLLHGEKVAVLAR